MTQRQPVHTVYGGAHLFEAGTARRLGELALEGERDARVARGAREHLVGAACGGESKTASTNERQATGPVRDIENVLALRSAFNSDRGKPRLLLILSPT